MLQNKNISFCIIILILIIVNICKQLKEYFDIYESANWWHNFRVTAHNCGIAKSHNSLWNQEISVMKRCMLKSKILSFRLRPGSQQKKTWKQGEAPSLVLFIWVLQELNK